MSFLCVLFRITKQRCYWRRRVFFVYTGGSRCVVRAYGSYLWACHWPRQPPPHAPLCTTVSVVNLITCVVRKNILVHLSALFLEMSWSVLSRSWYFASDCCINWDKSMRRRISVANCLHTSWPICLVTHWLICSRLNIKRNRGLGTEVTLWAASSHTL